MLSSVLLKIILLLPFTSNLEIIKNYQLKVKKEQKARKNNLRKMQLLIAHKCLENIEKNQNVKTSLEQFKKIIDKTPTLGHYGYSFCHKRGIHNTPNVCLHLMYKFTKNGSQKNNYESDTHIMCTFNEHRKTQTLFTRAATAAFNTQRKTS
ncbi:MAG: hypothetical protein WA432_03230 [Candidatus Babeliaceae bacterium]